MSQKKLRVIASGVLIFCLLSLLWTDYGDKVIGLTELISLSGAWACVVWLWPQNASIQLTHYLRLFWCATKAWYAAFGKRTLIPASPVHILMALSPLFWGAILYKTHRLGIFKWDATAALIISLMVIPLVWITYAFVLATREAFQAVEEQITASKEHHVITDDA